MQAIQSEVPDSKDLRPEVLSLRGYLSKESFRQAVERARQSGHINDESSCLIVNSLDMTDYDREARAAFVEWIYQRRNALKCVAVVTQQKMWRMVIHAMGLASSVKIQAFEDPRQAEDWIRTQPVKYKVDGDLLGSRQS